MEQQMPQNKGNRVKKTAALQVKQKLAKAHDTAAPIANSLATLGEYPLKGSIHAFLTTHNEGWPGRNVTPLGMDCNSLLISFREGHLVL